MTSKRKESKGPLYVLIVGLLIIAWFVAPLFLPVYKWLHVDLEAEASRAKVSIDALKQEYDFILRYNPRGNDHRDPVAGGCGCHTGPLSDH